MHPEAYTYDPYSGNFVLEPRSVVENNRKSYTAWSIRRGATILSFEHNPTGREEDKMRCNPSVSIGLDVGNNDGKIQNVVYEKLVLARPVGC